jgi:nitroimidazol reductase NimA-like FMN-containing flavoprotein (pyridoxamine 5'-phosphate oxidase superfamily)
MATDELSRSPLTEVRRKPDRASYERAAADAILDEGFVAHVGIQVDGHPFVIPTTYARIDDKLYLHGAVASRMLRAMRDGVPVCINVTLLDGLVLARSAFHHSMNYRSVVVVGTARRIRDLGVARDAVARIVDHIVPGRTAEARQPTDAELRQTTVLQLPIDTASVKIRSGGPLDEPEDMELDTWAGVVPVGTSIGEPESDEEGVKGLPVPASVRGDRRPGATGTGRS